MALLGEVDILRKLGSAMVVKSHNKLGGRESEREMTLVTRLASPGSFSFRDESNAERFEIEVLPTLHIATEEGE